MSPVVFSFDQFPNKEGCCFIRPVDDDNELVIKIEDTEYVVMRADRDQWGVFYNIGDHSIAQEDGTRSFLDGLIKCIQAFRDMHEHETTDATKKIGEI